MRKIALIVCALMLLSMVACATDEGNVDNNENGNIGDNGNLGNANIGDNLGDGIGDELDGALNDDNTGANANDGNFGGEERTLRGTAQGYAGEIVVTVVVNGDDIVSVEATGADETEGVGSLALDELPDKIAEADSTEVDSISGATMTSEGIKQAVNNALQGNAQSKQ